MSGENVNNFRRRTFQEGGTGWGRDIFDFRRLFGKKKSGYGELSVHELLWAESWEKRRKPVYPAGCDSKLMMGFGWDLLSLTIGFAETLARNTSGSNLSFSYGFSKPEIHQRNQLCVKGVLQHSLWTAFPCFTFTLCFYVNGPLLFNTSVNPIQLNVLLSSPTGLGDASFVGPSSSALEPEIKLRRVRAAGDHSILRVAWFVESLAKTHALQRHSFGRRQLYPQSWQIWILVWELWTQCLWSVRLLTSLCWGSEHYMKVRTLASSFNWRPFPYSSQRRSSRDGQEYLRFWARAVSRWKTFHPICRVLRWRWRWICTSLPQRDNVMSIERTIGPCHAQLKLKQAVSRFLDESFLVRERHHSFSGSFGF